MVRSDLRLIPALVVVEALYWALDSRLFRDYRLDIECLAVAELLACWVN